MYPGFGRWTIARVIGVFTMLFSVQAGAWPHAVLLAGACGTLSGILSLEACREFIGLRPVIPWLYFTAFTVILQLAYFEAHSGSSQLTYVELSFAWAGISVWTGVVLLGNLPPSARSARIAAGCTCLVNSVFLAGRTLYFIASPTNSLVDLTTLNLLFLIENLISGLAANVAFILMHYERVLAEKAEEVGRTAKANQTLTELKTHLEERVRQRTAELLQSRRLESVGLLAGGVAHDFNNILTVINGQSSRLLRQLPRLDPMREPLSQIEKAGEQAASLTRQLLRFSKQEKDDPKIISLQSFLPGLAEMLRRVIGEDIEIIFEPGPGAHNVRADKGHIEQIVMNLAINARDAMPGGGRLYIETSVTRVDDDFASVCLSLPPGTYVVIAVTDTGVGMTAEVQARVFEPFFTTKPPDQGTGLGLSTVYGMVKQSDGTVTVHSTPGLGSTFRVFLPSVDVAVEEPELVEPAAPLGGTETILLVEDRKEVREFLCCVLEENGYRTLDASSGDGAIAIASRYAGTIHLLITDMVLPGMTGPEIVLNVRALQPGIRVLRISGYTERIGRQIDDSTPFLQKPFSEETLLRQIRRILDESQEIPAVSGEAAFK